MSAFIISFLLSFFPLLAAAQIVPCAGVQCSACDLVKLAQNILNFLVTITVLMGGVIFAIAGFKMVTSAGNAGKVSEAKDMFTNVIVGLLILLAAWLIVDTVMKVFVNQTSSGIGPWYQIQCVAQPEPTKKTTVPSGSGVGTGVTVRDAQGKLVNASFDATQKDSALQQGFNSVSSKYENQINTACNGSPVPNCSKVVTALIASESGGNPGAQSSAGSVGLLQLLPQNGGRVCGARESPCIQEQINKGVSFLNTTYTSSAVGGNLPNALAGYNGGISTSVTGSPSGQKPPLAPSSDCPGFLAYQCAINPGGLQETRNYVGNICRTLSMNGSGCQ